MKLGWEATPVEVFEAQLPLAVDWAGAAELGPASPQQSATPQPLDRGLGASSKFHGSSIMIVARRRLVSILWLFEIY
jgi:hypothetical protein